MNKSPVTILAIEDDPDDLFLLERQFRSLPNYEVAFLGCRTCEAGLRRLEDVDEEVDLVLLDYQLTRETGVGVLKTMRDAGHRQPAIMITSYGDEDVIVDAFKAGASDYLRKESVSAESLARSVSNALEKAKLEEELAAHQASLAEANAELVAQNQAIRGLYHTLSHELKSPLTSVQSFLGLLLDNMAGELNEEQRDFAEVAMDSTLQLGRCVNDLVDATRLETGKVTLKPRSLDVGELLVMTNRALESQASDREIDLSCRVDESVPEVWADRDRIAQVLRNLIGNALKFTPSGGRVSVAARSIEDGACVRIEVRDTGRGIPKEHQASIFQRLQQVDREDASRERGMGLGLFICQEIATLHGSPLRVESELGEGSRFFFDLPCPDRIPSPSAQQEPASAVSTASSRSVGE